MANPVAHFEIIGPDGAALQAFYAELFGWQINAATPNYGLVAAEGDGGIGGGIGGSDAPGVTVYVTVDDLQAALDRAERLGGKTVMPPSEVPGGPAIAQFTDPAGNLIGLVKRA